MSVSPELAKIANDVKIGHGVKKFLQTTIKRLQCKCGSGLPLNRHGFDQQVASQISSEANHKTVSLRPVVSGGNVRHIDFLNAPLAHCLTQSSNWNFAGHKNTTGLMKILTGFFDQLVES